MAVSALGYVAQACLLTWPLSTQLTTQLLGAPTGDLGVYVWNLWIFGHELTTHHHLPFSTDHVFAYTNGADFSLHNYTALADLAGATLMPWLGVVGSFNVVLLLSLVASALGTMALARRAGLRAPAAWIAGAMFIASPAITTRETAHFSLVIAAALPLFVAALLRTLETRRRRDAILTGALVAAATYSDVYYGVYCLLMGLFVIVWRLTRVETRGPNPARSSVRRSLDAVMVAVLALIAWRLLSGTTVLNVGPLRIGLQTLYSPTLALMALAATRAWMTWRPTWRVHDPAVVLPQLVRCGALSVVASLVLLLPILVGIALRYLEGRLPDTPVYWRSSPRGVDLLGYFVPNPSHPWFGAYTAGWLLPPRADAFPEFVASFSLVAWALVAVALWRRALPRMWVGFTLLFLLLSLGPFVHVGGVNTTLVGPWALLRYVPVIGMARSPARFAITAALGLSLLFAFALEWWWSSPRPAARAFAGVLVVLVAFELLPAPRRLYSAAVPDVYRLIAGTDENGGRVLELPTGIRDGTSSVGDFNASSQFFQTRHGHALIGGYLSRVSEWRKIENRRSPMLRALFALSARQAPIPAAWVDEARRTRDEFLARSCIRHVVVDKRRASADLRAFAVDALDLVTIHEDADYELLVPEAPPACAPSSGRARLRLRAVF